MHMGVCAHCFWPEKAFVCAIILRVPVERQAGKKQVFKCLLLWEEQASTIACIVEFT